jgi:hypothetical protein
MTSPIKREVTIGNCRAFGCEGVAYSKGYCESHYRRFRKYGDPLAGKTPSREPELFLRKITETDACIDWPYQVNENGYGQIRFAGKMMNAHRASLIIHSGHPVCPDMHAAHEPVVCHNRRCVNPRHLRWATPKANMADRAIDGTVYRPVGELQGASKLTAAAVAEIRASGLPQKALAERFGVSKQQISKIIRRERWAHV